MNLNSISKRTKYIKTDGWRGYSQPVDAIAGANDTGTWSDSPCNSHVSKKERDDFKAILKKHKINFKSMTCSTSNVFCVHHYILVAPINREKALILAKEHMKNTTLFYSCES
jgi:hypothetical protein